MQFMTSLMLGVCALVLPIASARAQQAPEGGTLRCESNDGRTHQCSIDAGGGARVLRQLSRAPCVEGQTWGRMRNAIWVTRGCRAEFLAWSALDRRSGGRPASDGMLRCSSDDGRWRHCAADVRGGVDLVRQVSRNACIRGQSWGVDRRGVWVNGGCRAEFRLNGRSADDDAGPMRFRCESDGRRERTCPLRTRGTVRLVKQLSNAPCEPGRGWGVDGDAVWVAEGCRAEFEVGGWADGRW